MSDAVTQNDEHLPRIYASFAEFEHDELRRLGLASWPPIPDPSITTADPPAIDLLPALVPVMAAPPVLPPADSIVPAPARTTITPAALRAEGILEIGRVSETSALFVRTRVKLHLLHTTWLPDRQLDDYAVRLAVTWIEGHGMPSCKVAKNLEVSETKLRCALSKAGYERLSLAKHDQLVRARSRKLGKRRGKLVRSSNTKGACV